MNKYIIKTLDGKSYYVASSIKFKDYIRQIVKDGFVVVGKRTVILNRSIIKIEAV